MLQQSLLRVTGLKTNENYLTTDRSGMKIARNVNIDRPNVAESRKGLKEIYRDVTESNTEKLYILADYGGRAICWYDDKIVSVESGDHDIYSGAYAAPDSEIGIRAAVSMSTLFITDDTGVKSLDGVAGDFVSAGIPKCFPLVGTLDGASGFLTHDRQVAYRVVIKRVDSQGRVLLGAPSERTDFVNPLATGASRNVDTRTYLPADALEDDYIQIYRSYMSADESTPGSDTLYMVAEVQITGTDITNGYVDFLDELDESLLGATLYTSPAQEGILQGNAIPPWCKDLCTHKGMMFYANTRTRHVYDMLLIGVGGTNGIADGDTITFTRGVDTFTLTAKNAPANPGEFLVSSAATVAEQIAETARSIVLTAITYASNTFLNAYYMSGYEDYPGKILWEARDFEDDPFSITSDQGGAFSPELPNAGTSQSSYNEIMPNRVYISKVNQPEAVPILNYIDCGDREHEIRRIIALRDAVFALKDNGEIFRITGGSFDSISVSQLESSIRIIGARTPAVVNNRIMMFSEQGIVSLGDTGYEIVSYDIENQVQPLKNITQNPDLPALAFGVADEENRKYIFVYEDYALVYNYFTGAWTKWDGFEFYSGLVVNERLMFGSDDGKVYMQRDSGDYTDYGDLDYAITITAKSNYDVTVTSASIVPIAGMGIYQSGAYAYVDSVVSLGGGSYTLTLNRIALWTLNAAKLYTPITCELGFLPVYGDNPAQVKKFSEISLAFDGMNENFDVDFYSNFDPETVETITITTSLFYGYGSLPFGAGLYGGNAAETQEYRTFIPLKKMRAIWLRVLVRTERPFTKFQLSGVNVFYHGMQRKFTKEASA